MRIKGKKTDINYTDTYSFFENRVKKFNNDNPYSVTMYQDNNPELVKARNEKEIDILLPKLKLDRHSRILDVACGIGRWSDAIKSEIECYCGVDFSEGLIDIAIERNKNNNRTFLVGNNTDLKKNLEENNKGTFNRILIIGALPYMNDEDVDQMFKQIEQICEPQTIICIREPIGITERLTLKDNYSEELNDNYNAVYRSRDEIVKCLSDALLSKGFVIEEEDYLFKEQELNNRKETSQYYFILKR